MINKMKQMPLGVRAGIWFAILQYAQQAMVILATPVFTRIMSADAYGLVNVYNTWSGLLTILLTLRLSASIYQLQMVEYKEDRDNLTASLVTVSILILAAVSLVFALFRGAVSALLKLPFKMLLVMLAHIWAQMVLSFWLTRNKFEYKYQKCLAVVLSSSALKTLLSLLLVYYAKGEQSYYKVLGDMLPDALFAAGILVWIYRKGKKRFITAYWWEAIKFNIVIVPSYLSDILLASSDRLMINAYRPNSDVALYSIAYSCAHLIQLFFLAINWVFTPYAYTCLEQKRYDQLRKTANVLTLCMAVLTGLLVAFAPEAIAIFAPKSYYEAIWVIPPAACGIFLTFIYGFFVNAEYFHKKNVCITVATIIGAAVNIGLNWLLIPKFGYLAAAYTTVAGYLVLTALHYFFYKRTFAADVYDIKALLGITACLYIFSGVCLILYDRILIRYFVICGILAIAVWHRKRVLETVKTVLAGKTSDKLG